MDEKELNWIAYLIGKITEDELLPENQERLKAHLRERKESLVGGVSQRGISYPQ